MRKCFFLVFILVVLLNSCRMNVLDKTHPCGSIQIDDSLFLESYIVWSGGATNGDCVSEYITDSLSFRKYVTSVDDHHWPNYIVNGDCVVVSLNSYCTPLRDTTIVYSIMQLKQKKEWE